MAIGDFDISIFSKHAQVEPRFTETRLIRTPFFVPWEISYIFSEFNSLEGALSPLFMGGGLLGGGVTGGGVTWVNFCWVWPLASQKPYPIIVYSGAIL